MKLFSAQTIRPVAVYAVVVITVSAAIWSAKYFAPQDGSAHVYNAFLISELVKGNPTVGAELQLNTFIVPNATGHWVLTLLLQGFSAFTSLKILTAGTFAAFVASIMWLRYSTAGANGLMTSVLIGAALGLNWFWFGGFYNFIIGVIGSVFLVTLYFRWRSKMGPFRASIIALLFVIIYLSHLFSFALTAGTVFTLALSARSDERRRDLIYFFVAVFPSVVMALIYRWTTDSPEGLHPVWRWWSDNISAFGIIRGLLVDPFIIISRRAIPFWEAKSDVFAIFMPGFWTVLSLLLLAFPLLKRLANREVVDRQRLPFLVLLALSIVAALVAPDDFQVANGGIMRERMLLCGLCLFVPLFDVTGHKLLERFAQICLVYVIVFQSAAIWDYGQRTSPVVEAFSLAQSAISDDDTVASIEMIDDAMRFHSVPEPQLGLITSVGKRTFLFDNYEIGHYLFPVITKDLSDRRFARAFATAHAFAPNGSQNEFDETLSNLDALLNAEHKRFTKIILWGRDERVEGVLYKWFDRQAIFETDKVRVFRHRDPS